MLTIEELAELVEKYRTATTVRVAEFSLGDVRFDFNSRRFIMGVVNLSAESWYRESVCLSAERAIERGAVLSAQGAQIVDVGAEATLANARRIESAEQDSQLLPVVKGLVDCKILVSVETYHPSVTRSCLEAGAHGVNLTRTVGGEGVFKLVAGRDAG